MDKKKWFLMNSGGSNQLLTSLVSYWSFNADATDVKGTNNGTLTGGATIGAGGILSNGVVLAGDQYVQVADHNSLSFGNGTTDTPFSYSLWVKPTNFLQNAWLIGKRNAGQAEYQILINVTTGSISGALFSQLGVTAYLGRATTQVTTAGAWNHIVFTYSGSKTESGMNFYINGALCTMSSTGAGSYVAMSNGTSVMDIGSYPNFPTTSEVIGMMDEVGLWSKELTQTDVTRLYNGGAGLAYTSFT